MQFIMQYFELILTLAVFICFIFYIIDGASYRKQRKHLYKVFRADTADKADRTLYAQRLNALNFERLSKKHKALFERITQKLDTQEPLVGQEYYWTQRPVFPKEKFIEFFGGMFWVLFIVWFLRSFLFEPFKIPSSSMEPTLQAGDFILTNKFTYGVRLPVNHQKIFSINEVKHGDVIVFRYPKNEKINYIKRVIGVPGDNIRFDSGRVWLNGEAQTLTATGEHNGFDQFIENLSGKSHQIQFSQSPLMRKYWQGSFVVPANNYFVMGDNRDNSEDGRVWGFVPEENLVGKAFFIWLNSDCILARGHCKRIGQTIK